MVKCHGGFLVCRKEMITHVIARYLLYELYFVLWREVVMSDISILFSEVFEKNGEMKACRRDKCIELMEALQENMVVLVLAYMYVSR